MSDLKNPFGLRNGNIIMIEDILQSERGKACNCVCPACKGPFIARLGDKRTHHFAHSGEGCDEEIAFLMGMYRLVQEYILGTTVRLPEVAVYWRNNETEFTERNFFERISLIKPTGRYNKVEAVKAKSVKFESAEIRFKGKRPTALLLSKKSHQMAVCMKPPATVCKMYTVKPYETRGKKLATIQLDVADISFGQQKKEQILALLEKKMHISGWLYNPLAIRVLDTINGANSRWIEAQRRQRIQREQEEQRRRKQLDLREKNQQKRMEGAIRSNQNERDKEDEIRKQEYEKELNIGFIEVFDKFNQQETPIIDRYGRRWIQCKFCRKKDIETSFASYGDLNSVNLGICNECSRLESSTLRE